MYEEQLRTVAGREVFDFFKFRFRNRWPIRKFGLFGTSIAPTQQSFLSNLLAFGHKLPFCPFVLWPMECDSFCLNRCFVSLKQSCAPSELVSTHQPSTFIANIMNKHFKWAIWNQFWKRSYGFLWVATFETMTNPIFWNNVGNEQFGTSFGS